MPQNFLKNKKSARTLRPFEAANQNFAAVFLFARRAF
jgi:hypothetical protein